MTRPAHDARVRLGGLTIWHIPCTTCKAVCTVRPHCVVRDRTLRPAVAREALLAPPGGRSLAWCAPIAQSSPMALSRLVWALGQQRLGAVLTRCALPLPVDILADERHRRCPTEQGDLPTIVSSRVLWHLGDSASKRARALTASSGALQRAALAHEPSYRVRGALTDGFESTTKGMGLAAPGHQSLRAPFHALRHRCRQRPLRVVARGQR